MQVVSLDGHWYLDAFCHRAGGLRRFRVDRIRRLTELDPVPGDLPTPRAPSDDAFIPGPGSEVVQLELGPGATWVVDSVPVLESAERRADGGADVTLAVGGTAWFERLLLQAGPVGPGGCSARVARPRPAGRGARPRSLRRVAATVPSRPRRGRGAPVLRRRDGGGSPAPATTSTTSATSSPA